MNKNMRQICREIQQGNNLEVNLPQFFNRLVTLYEQYAEIKFTMHYYTFYESYIDSNLDKTPDTKQLLAEVNHIIKGCLLSDFSGEKMENGVKRLDAVRNQIMNQMKMLTAYTDVLQNYEYVLNRIEYRFRDDLVDINNDEFATEILRYIFDSKDNVIINDKIKEVIGQLPVRITKSKYFEIIRDSISIYKGSDSSTLDTFIYMLKTGAMLYTQEGMDTDYPDLFCLRKEFQSLDYKNLTQEEYDIYSNKIKSAATSINNSVDFYYGMQEIVNHLYVMLLTSPYAYMEGGYKMESVEGEMKYLLLPIDQDTNVLRSIIEDINKSFLANEKSTISKETEEKLCYTEGKQETLSEEFEALEPVLSDIKSCHISLVESLMLGRVFYCLDTSQKLLSDSLFVELNQMESNDIPQADQAHIAKVQEELIAGLTELFLENSKNVGRAVIANTINKTPIFLMTTNDVMDYVKNSLEQCHDLAEKIACVNIIKTFWEN